MPFVPRVGNGKETISKDAPVVTDAVKVDEKPAEDTAEKKKKKKAKQRAKTKFVGP